MTDEPNSVDEPAERPDAEPDVEATTAGEDYGDYGRRWAAWHAGAADSLDACLRDMQQALAKATRSAKTPDGVRVPSLDGLLASIEQTSQGVKLLGSLGAADALAWDRMQEAGGEENPEAFAEFVAASELHKALALDPRPDMDDPDPTDRP